jgi:hypothetical protein
MLSAGYLLKRVVPPPGWLVAAPNHIKDVCSVSDCVNDNVVDVQDISKHNSFGVANSPSVLWALAEEAGVDTSGASYFTTPPTNVNLNQMVGSLMQRRGAQDRLPARREWKMLSNLRRTRAFFR